MSWFFLSVLLVKLPTLSWAYVVLCLLKSIREDRFPFAS
jgi:hypothetical protein